jgi:hypothetical protein
MFFSKKKALYSYTPSFEIKTKNKLELLTLKYQPIFLYFIENKNLKKEDEVLFIDGIKEVSTYILQGVFYQIKNNFNSKTNTEKKLNTLYYMLMKYYSSIDINYKIYIEEEIYLLAEESVYEALGMKLSDKNKTFFISSETSNFIKYAKANLFYKVILLLEKKVNPIKNEFVSVSESLYYEHDENFDISEEDIDNVFKLNNFHLALPADILIELKHAILTREFPEHIRPYLERLASKQ